MQGLASRFQRTHMASGMSIGWLLENRAQQFANDTFLIWEPFEGPARSWTYAGFTNQVAQVAAGLQRRGVGHGDFVLIHLENSPEFLLTWFACAWLGAVAVSTNTRSALDELAYYADHSGAQVAVTSANFADMLGQAMPQARAIIVVGDAQGDDSFASLLNLPAIARAPVSDLDRAAVQYTSGTTGRPKAVLWNHANALWGGRVNAIHEGLTRQDRLLVFLPLFHTNAQTYSVMSALWAGASLVLQPRFSTSRFWDVSVRNRCTFASQIGFSMKALAQQEAPPDHSYRLWGTHVNGYPDAVRIGIPTIGWWGMTETISHGIVGDLHVPNTPMTIGRAAPEYGVSILNEDGRPVEPGETGELRILGIPGLSLFSCYLHNEEATRAAFDDEGWFITGDRVTLHENGAISFADRAKDMLKIGAENVAASEIERVAAVVPGVGEVAVVAKPHPMLDEVPVAFVIPSGDVTGLEQAVIDACRAKLADFKVPHEVRLVDELPRATLEKVAKQKLRDLLRAEAREQAKSTA